jgi:hypothetical protein
MPKLLCMATKGWIIIGQETGLEPTAEKSINIINKRMGNEIPVINMTCTMTITKDTGLMVIGGIEGMVILTTVTATELPTSTRVKE